MAVVILITNGGRIQASYRGREYIEVGFGTSGVVSAVINVFDYATDKPRIPNTPEAVFKALVAWLAENNPQTAIYQTLLVK